MRLSQPKGEATEFQAMFEAALKEIHPDYELNKIVRGVRTEFLRELAPNLYASHNAYCKKGRYYHGFCITLHRDLPTPYLHSPFTAGGRFDHNHSINIAIQRDLSTHIILSDSHEFRKGCDRIISRCTAEAEKILLPHYMGVFDRAKHALRLLAEMVASDIDISEPEEVIRGFGWSIGDLDCNMIKFSEMFAEQSGREPFLRAIVASKPELFQRLRKKSSIDPSKLA